MAEKTRYWVGVLYTENMIKDWQENIADILELPFAYCIHDSDKSVANEDRKQHVHLMVMWPSPTTYKHALSVFKLLGEKSVNLIKKVISPLHMYNYLIHDTEECKKKGKYLYPKSFRVTGNNFDIDTYVCISQDEKEKLRDEISHIIVIGEISNYTDLFIMLESAYDKEYLNILVGYSSHFERLCRGNYLKKKQKAEKEKAEKEKEEKEKNDI